MNDLYAIQQQLRAQLEQVDRLVMERGTPQVPTEEQIYQMVDTCVRKYLSASNFAIDVFSIIKSSLNDSDKEWLENNLNEIIPFLKTSEGYQVIQYVLQMYKTYKGNYHGDTSSIT